MNSPSRPRSRPQDDRAVLAGVKAKPSRWPAASLDTAAGGVGQHRSGAGKKKDQPSKIRLQKSLRFGGIADTHVLSSK
jgi:hypothetical protein